MIGYDYVQISLARSETTTLSLSVPPWEVPILQILNGSENVTVLGSKPVRRDLPEAQAEYDRLAARYGRNEDDGRELVAMAYGHGPKGVAALGAEIAKSKRTLAETAPAPKVSASADANSLLRDLDMEVIELVGDNDAEGSEVVQPAE